MITTSLIAALGSSERKPEHVAFVSLWVIPGGYDYVNARVQTTWLAEHAVETAKKLVDRLSNPPEMAFMGTVEEFDKAQSRSRPSTQGELA